ncbi:hypothetical protein U9M48_007935 [Paspalum notatum var. saurae]|uniref:Uncharacterized protein n=1 Tax=Paspalum notatum var. saurae TaxID=547442 RepID=A0AAQ3WCR7_PASNO
MARGSGACVARPATSQASRTGQQGAAHQEYKDHSRQTISTASARRLASVWVGSTLRVGTIDQEE